jgi:hypothetical protein
MFATCVVNMRESVVTKVGIGVVWSSFNLEKSRPTLSR